MDQNHWLFDSWLLNLKDYKITVEGIFLILLLFLKLTNCVDLERSVVFLRKNVNHLNSNVLAEIYIKRTRKKNFNFKSCKIKN